MTAEEALEILNGNKDVWRELGYESIREFNKDWDIAFDMAIQALKQEPCEDCISREKAIKQCGFGMTSLLIADCLRKLPSVTPKSKTGHWIYTPKRRLDDETDEGFVHITDYRCTCSECGGDFGFQKMSDAYCKYCGAKMESEGEDDNTM